MAKQFIFWELEFMLSLKLKKELATEVILRDNNFQLE